MHDLTWFSSLKQGLGRVRVNSYTISHACLFPIFISNTGTKLMCKIQLASETCPHFLSNKNAGLLVWYVVYLLEALFFNPTAKGLMRLKQTAPQLSCAAKTARL